ncbi:hypothetical protein BDV96DRAFT_643281 [Lophiotrema nucula]|uniref:Uncharacterized protein n=1 Tax=Lophiotrema nucula TaxID=690887 RepID=A0A6A5ZHU1_9PLEO|nr:hypothetical protein BDV96DRAFT_643281 [Lophiotrema nucula]
MSPTPSPSTIPFSSVLATIAANCQQNIPTKGKAAIKTADALTPDFPSICPADFSGSGDSTHENFNHGNIERLVVRNMLDQKLERCMECTIAIVNTCSLGNNNCVGIAAFNHQMYNISNMLPELSNPLFGNDHGAAFIHDVSASESDDDQ